nr:FHA domain-containing protein [Anaerolineae bacterium]
MSLEITLFVIRIVVAVLLYAFLGTVLFYCVRDIHTASAQAPEKPGASARLVIVESENVPLEPGLSFDLLPLTTIGRGQTCTVVLPDSFASTEHARIACRKEQWWLDDLDSRNGTLLNDFPVTGTVVLAAGDLIRVGRVTLRFDLV